MSTNKLCDVTDTLVGVKLATIGKSAPCCSDSSVVMDRNDERQNVTRLCKAACQCARQWTFAQSMCNAVIHCAIQWQVQNIVMSTPQTRSARNRSGLLNWWQNLGHLVSLFASWSLLSGEGSPKTDYKWKLGSWLKLIFNTKVSSPNWVTWYRLPISHLQSWGTALIGNYFYLKPWQASAFYAFGF